jgi:hypothetical protein
MAIYRNRSWLVKRSDAATSLLMTTNVIIFGLCLRASGSEGVLGETLFNAAPTENGNTPDLLRKWRARNEAPHTTSRPCVY